MRSERPVAIVGGGFSGTMTALHLARRGVPNVLIDGSGRMGRGVAYSTGEAVHLLNVPAAKMSAWPDRMDDFAEWHAGEGTDFAERRAFGRYLGEQLAGAAGVEQVEAMAVAAKRDGDGWRVRLDDDRELTASALVLALGNQPPAPFGAAADIAPELFVNNPWGEEAKAAVARVAENGDDVLILGTGLTMVDTVLSLVAAGHEGRITALSRRGLVPRAHADPPAAPAQVELAEVPAGSLMELWRWLRRRSGEVGFRAAVDALRPHSHAIWQNLSPGDRTRFLRHARPWWDVHRHRIAPQVGAQLKELIAAGRLEIVAGRLRSLAERNGKLRATIARRGGRTAERGFGVAFNCTGPLGDLRRTADPLLAGLLARNEVQIDRLALALDVDGRSRAGPGVWALGPLSKGRYWEIVAVPDIRGQAAAVAADIAAELEAR